jgi:hypothetical protein
VGRQHSKIGRSQVPPLHTSALTMPCPHSLTVRVLLRCLAPCLRHTKETYQRDLHCDTFDRPCCLRRVYSSPSPSLPAAGLQASAPPLSRPCLGLLRRTYTRCISVNPLLVAPAFSPSCDSRFPRETGRERQRGGTGNN